MDNVYRVEDYLDKEKEEEDTSVETQTVPTTNVYRVEDYLDSTKKETTSTTPVATSTPYRVEDYVESNEYREAYDPIDLETTDNELTLETEPTETEQALSPPQPKTTNQSYLDKVDVQLEKYLKSDDYDSFVEQRTKLVTEQAIKIDEIGSGQTEEGKPIPFMAGLGAPRELTEEQITTGEDVKLDQVLAYESKSENIAANVKNMVNDPNPVRASMTRSLLDKGYDFHEVNYIVGGADWTPFLGTVLGVIDAPENLTVAKELYDQGNAGGAAAILGLTLAELGASIIGGAAVVKKVTKNVKGNIALVKTIKDAEAIDVAEKKTLSSKVAKANAETKQSLIKEFEISIGARNASGEVVDSAKLVSQEDSKGKLSLDNNKARTVGLSIAEEVNELQNKRAVAFLNNSDQAAEEFADTFGGSSVGSDLAERDLASVEELVSPLLDPDKFDSIVAISADLKSKYGAKYFPKNKSIIDSLFELTVSNRLDGDGPDAQELADILSKYGLTFDDYVLMVTGSGSEAGKILNKLSQIRRAGSLGQAARQKQRAIDLAQGSAIKTWRRIENIRRGGMVSMIKTATRNFGTATMRAPAEALENVFSTVILNMQDEFINHQGKSKMKALVSATAKGTTSLASPEVWKGSTRSLQRIFANPKLAKDITDFILDRPEFSKQFSEMFDMVNEYQTTLGRGEAKTIAGKGVDFILSTGEDIVGALNTPNRIQEFIIRRGTFMGELERLVKKEYGSELLDLLQDGKIQDLIQNSSNVRPKGSRAFEELIEDSTRRALDVTFASQPEIKFFADASNWLTRNGLTVVTTPFPRFMFKSIELMGQYSAGAFNPILKRAMGLKGGKLDNKDVQNISRNMVGVSAIAAALMYRNSEGAPADYKLMGGDDGTVTDTTAFFPLRQALWFAEAIKRLAPTKNLMDNPYALPVVPLAAATRTLAGETGEGEGTFGEWFDLREANDVFLGGAGRGTGFISVFANEMADILSTPEVENVTGNERKNRLAARFVSDYVRTWGIPLTQVVEAQRALGYRPTTARDAATDNVTLGATFGEQLSMEMKRMGKQSGLGRVEGDARPFSNILNPSKEYENPVRVSIFADEGVRERKGLGTSLVAGVTKFTRDSEDAEYLERLGFNEFELSSKERTNSIRVEENKYLLTMLPTTVEVLKEYENMWTDEYNSSSTKQSYRDSVPLESHIATQAKPYVKKLQRIAKDLVKEAKLAETKPIFIAHRSLRRANPDLRKIAIRKFRMNRDEEIDFRNVDHINEILGLIEAEKKSLPRM